MGSTPSNGPRPLDRRPGYSLPPGSWDSHCHVFGPAGVFPLAEARTYTPPDVPAKDLADLHQQLGFQHAVLVQAAAHGTDHRAMIDAIARSGGRHRGVMLPTNPAKTDFTALHGAGIRGVRYNLTPDVRPDFAAVRRVAERIRDFGWHIALHGTPASFGSLGRWLDFGTPVVIDHCGRIDLTAATAESDLDTLLDFLGSHQAWMKLSGIDRISRTGAPYVDAVAIARRFLQASPDRCIWGTDFPHPNHHTPPHDADLVDAIPALAPSAADQQALLVDNPKRLYA